VLGPSYDGVQELRGEVLSDDVDPALQALAEQTSRELDAPMAAVTLMLERVQLLRGFHGLPPDLAAARGIDRDMSFCQFAVRDGAVFEVNDARTDARVPQASVKRYGTASYLGAPVYIGGKAVGAMCVADSKPRTFDAADREAIVRAAAVASARLSTMAMSQTRRIRVLHDRAVRPAFQELRNRMQPLMSNIGSMQIALTEIAASHRLAQHIAATGEVAHAALLTRTHDAIAALREMLGELSEDADAIRDNLLAVERASLANIEPAPFAEIIATSKQLAHHYTKLVGGVRTTGDSKAQIAVERAVAVRTVASAFSGYAELLFSQRAESGIDVELTVDDTHASATLSSDCIGAAAVRSLANELRALVDNAPSVAVRVRASRLELAFAR